MGNDGSLLRQQQRSRQRQREVPIHHPDASAVSRGKRSSYERVCKIREGLATLAQVRATKQHADEVVGFDENL
jgi:hypothetical protein